MVEIIEIKEKDDGSAEILANFTDEEIELLISYAVNDIFRKALEEDVRRSDEGDK